MLKDKFHLIGYACGVAGADSHTGDGPLVIQKSSLLLELQNQGYTCLWDAMIHPNTSNSLTITEIISQTCEELAAAVAESIRKQRPLTVIGGDHTCAIGTWSGVYDAMHTKGDIGLIWIDAHMDSHTPETSDTGRIHGMPVACLLGYGYPSLTTILNKAPKIKPENICLIGIRSFEQGEADLLERLNVRVYYMSEVKKRGFDTVLKEAVSHVSAHTIGYGLSLDIDAIDPGEAPGVDVPEPDGIQVKDLLKGLTEIVSDAKLIATEIVEFDPSRDRDQSTEKVIVSLLEIIHSHAKKG